MVSRGNGKRALAVPSPRGRGRAKKLTLQIFPSFPKFPSWPTSNAPASFARMKPGRRNSSGAGGADGGSPAANFAASIRSASTISNLDFFCEAAELNVELDGSQHGFPDQRKHDWEREKFLQSRGIKTLRFWNSHLQRNAQSIRDGRMPDTPTTDGRANLPVCPNLTASQRSNAGGTLGMRTREHRSARSGGSLGGAAAPPHLGGGVKLRPSATRSSMNCRHARRIRCRTTRGR